MLNNHYIWASIVWVFLFKILNADDPKNARIISYENENHDPKKYHFKYETSDGIFREEYGEIVTVDNKEILTVRGKYSYIGTNNVLYVVSYTADEKGYRAEKVEQLLSTPGFAPPVGPTAVFISSNAIKTLQGGGIG
ncbi:hypothetical protein RI129_005032 [Pyrocoelia pectoralis]|uniref:Uncharacterized protein n=1 Tax=Pyrocoelia pectoralis TaxID=417401 RepID=A0AAN7ZRG1_9COLE